MGERGRERERREGTARTSWRRTGLGERTNNKAIFETFSTALEWVAMHKLGVTKAIHVIDDFLFLATSRAKCLADMQAFIKMCGDLGVPLATGKTVGPSTALQFLGITIDAVKMEARLPEDKLTQCRLLLRLFLSRHKKNA